MGWVYEIKPPEALTWSRHFFVLIKVYNLWRVQLINEADNNRSALKHAGNIANCFDDD